MLSRFLVLAITLCHCETSTLKFDFVPPIEALRLLHSTSYKIIATYCRLAQTYGIFADPVTNV